MEFNEHLNLEGLHAPFGASKSSWLRYDDTKALDVYKNMQAAEYGTRLHAWAKETIDLGLKQPRSNRTLCAYVNDAIGFRMKPEQPLYFSDNCFGTADAIAYSEDEQFLRIHDLKTGITPVADKYGNLPQLEIYAALFFLEYDLDLNETDIELRVYQNDDIIISNPGIDRIAPIMDKIVAYDKIIDQIKREEL